MPEYADPELLVAGWLQGRLNDETKVWADPTLPYGWQFNAPLVHVQRGQDFGDTQLALDAAILDIGVYATNVDHARAMGDAVRTAMRFELPLHTFGNGILCTTVQAVSAPMWLPFQDPTASTRSGTSPTVARRSAAYRVVFAGLLA